MRANTCSLLRPSRLEGVAEEVERDVFILPRPVVVLAVDDPGLRGMKLQTAVRETTPDRLQHRLCFRLATYSFTQARSVWWATARSIRSRGMESKKALMSRSMTQSVLQQRFRAVPTASSADRPGR